MRSNSISSEEVFTRFGESLTSFRTSKLNLKPTWGISTLRYSITNTGTGATAGETNGEVRLQSGTANNGISTVRTLNRGQYQAGAMGQCGIGIRIPTLPLTTAFCEWGYTDFTNGFYFGVDGTGKYIADVTGGSVTKVYQSSWNIDKLDGTGESGKTLTLSDGLISQIDFTWYGYGDIEFGYFFTDNVTNKISKVVCHRLKKTGSVSVIDPNQPIAFRTGNGASTTTNVSLYIGGHQFSVIDGDSVPQERLGSELCTNYTTATDTNWQPIIAVRKSATFNGRTNSVLVSVVGFEISGDGEMEVRLTVGGTTSNGTWGTPTGRTATETAIETKVTSSGTILATSVAGEPVGYGFISATKSNIVAYDTQSFFPIGATTEAIIWIRRLVGTGSIIVKHAHIDWTEQW